MDRFKELERLVREFLLIIGEDVSRDGLVDTPSRVARMWLDELTIGYRVDPREYLKSFNIDEGDYERHGDLVIIKEIPVRSICEHHLLPFFGYTHIAYIPRDNVLGFSKFARVVEVFSRRLQVQERLTDQIADFIVDYLHPKGLLVIVEAVHTCALIRGVKELMYMVTRAVRGSLASDDGLRREVMMLLSVPRLGSRNASMFI